MTKTQEARLLDETIARFGQNSYLGPWLASIRAELIADMTNDVTPDAMLPAAAHAEAQQILQAAREQAAKTDRDMLEWAKGFEASVREKMDHAKRKARIDLERLAASL